MSFFRSKKKLEDTIYDRNQVVKSCDVLIELAKTQELKDDIKKIKEDIKFSKPCNDFDVVKVDKKIEKDLGDLKILLSNNKSDVKIADKIEDIRFLIVERNSKVD